MDTTVDINGIFMANDGINMMGYNPFFYQKSCLLCQKKTVLRPPAAMVDERSTAVHRPRQWSWPYPAAID